MAGPRDHLLLCLLALCLAGSSFIGGQKVQSRRCDVKTKFVTHIPCTPCPAIKKRVCPSGWLREFPEKISQDCRYEVQLGDSLLSVSGCSLECSKDVVQKACCPGYWGSQCYECPGGAETPCNSHGTCLDGIDRNGTCVCQENFSGSACQECRDPNRFGPDCQSVCSCVHGVCRHGPLGDGSCLCFAGFTGPHCDQELPVCQALNCPQNSQCSAEAPTCSCLPGHTQQGGECLAPDPCQPSPCSPVAQCSVSPRGQAQCRCPENYHGDGTVCLPQDPCTTNNGGCPSNSTLCLYKRPGQAFCSCKPGLVSTNHNASAGCFAYCFPYSCDRSATCQVTPDGKTSCVCKEGEVGDGRACYGHLLHEVQKASQTSMTLLRLRVAFAMLDQGCREILTTSGPFTVLAPSISSRTMNASLAQHLCRQHIIAGQHMLEESGIQPTRRWWTLAGQEITVTFSRFRQKYTYKYKDQPQQTFTIHKANYPAANGIFHVVTALRWQPPPELPEDPKRTIGQILASTEAFTRFETILENCGLPSFLDGPGPFTVFAPSNEAVDGLRDGRLVYLFTAGLSKLQELVRYHVYSHGQLTVEKLISKGRVLTMANQVLAVNISEEGRILLGPEGVPLRRVDVLAANGVIHMLEGILLPPTILPILPKLCNEEQHKVVAGSCVDCQALNTSMCPHNSVKLDISPEECVYIHDPTGLNVLKKGCAHYCNQTILKPGCCKGFFGPDCVQCPGGFSNPCYGKGNCSDGVQGSGACLCFPDYKGIACHICSNPNKHGEQCREDCGCVHGLCDNRPGSGGVCQRGTCAPGFSGRFCNESTGNCGPTEQAQQCHPHARCVNQGDVARCLCLDGFEGDGFSCTPSNPCSRPDRGGCSENAECVPGAPGTHHCTCHKGWSGDGRVCVAIDECELDVRGGCHADALCSYVGPGQSQCACKLGFAGDGYMCSPIDPCRAGNGGCHDLATCRAVGGGQRVCTCPPGYGGDGFSCYGDIFQELEANAHFSIFYQWIKGAGITLPANSRVTALVPSESAIRRLSPEDQAFWLQPRMLPQLVRAHFLQGALSEEELARLDGQSVATLSPTARWEIHNISGRVWVQNASVDVADLLATNGVLHVLSQVLLPPRGDVLGGQGLLQQLDSVPAFRLFRELLQRHRLVPQIEAATAYTIFVPTNHSLEAQANSSSLDLDVVRHHVILGEALSTEALRRGGHRNSLLGPAHWLVFYNHSGQPEVNHVPLEGPVLEAPGRSLFGLSGVLMVGSSRCLHSHAEALREKCVNCTRKFRCTQGYQLEDTPKKSCVYRSGYSFFRGCSYTCAKKIQCVTVPTGCARTGSEGTEAVSVTWVGRASAVTRKSLALSAHRSVTPMPTVSRTRLQPLPASVPRGTRATASTVQNNGGCSPYAVCKSTGDGQRMCTCDAVHTVGDGFTCRARVGLDLLREKHASFFSLHLLEYKELKGDGPFTIFVPHADLMTNLSQDELARIRANRQLVFRYHVVGCRQLRSQELLEEGYATTLSGHPLRFSEREGSIYINDFARMVSSDHEAVNGVLHFIDRVLLPPEALHWEPDAAPILRRNFTAAAESFGYKIFSGLVTMAGLLPLLRDSFHRPFTMLWPTDSALQALPPDRQVWLYHKDHRDKLAAILRGHVIRNVEALASDLPNLGPLRTMHGTPISFSCSRARPGELTVGEEDARIVQRHLPFEGGLAYGIDQLLEPPGLGARCDRFETRPLWLKVCSICGLEPPCPEGSQEQGSPEACWRYFSKFWTSPPLHSLALRSVWARPSHWGQPQGLGRGCYRNCVTTTWKPSCCPGHYGSECRACPGGASSPCNGHGTCMDGMSGRGDCRCRSRFAGMACELCAPGAFGPLCQACNCTSHGHCDEGLGGTGYCFCDEGWTGPHCEVQLELQPVCAPPCASQAVCRAGHSCECSLGYEGDGRTCTVVDLCQDGRGGCSEHANCSQVGTVVTCTCLPDYEGDGWSCRARNPCEDGHRGGCSEHADCLSTGPNTRRCACHAGYVGDGLQCLEEPEPPVDRCLDQPPPCHVDAVCTDLHFQEKRAGVFHLQAPSGPYSLNFSQAEAACGAQGAVLASLPQLSAAQQLGLHLCLVGWLANGSAAHPVVFPAADCGDGQVGVVSLGARENLSERWDAYCYRMQDVACRCRDGFVGDGASVCNGKLLDVLATTANFSTFYGMLLGYANATPRGLDFLDFLDDELTYKTLFVPVNEGFMDNLTLSGPDLELHASNTTFLSTNASQGTLLPAHSGLSLIISDMGPDNSSRAPVVPGAVVVGHVIVWDIVAFNGIIHTLASPLLAPPQPRAAVAPEAPPVAAGAGAVVAAGVLLGLAAGVLYLRARSRSTGFGFSAFQVEDDAADDFSPWQEGTSPTLVSVPNPVFGSHDAFCEPFDSSPQDSLLEDDFPDTQRILEVK
ncbi:stabilin-1 isoform X12 [Physeter macrocephalus]|uniref:Stabilin-1 isoform X12 n=1 Tax=Physeter macrocephalus TaxID=9755 RepID=A0A9W2W884_PHYMC|nr:stabilin-1 isoform X12 [Physeter catodon]